MTYPPQQPGPYGQNPYGQQPQTPPYGGQSSYQGLGSYGAPPPPPPPPKKTGMIVAIVLIVLLVVGGGGVAIWVLTKGDDKDTTASDGDTDKSTAPSSEPSETTDTETTETTDPNDAINTPDDVRTAYMEAYENKSFSEVVASSCAAYKTKYGTDTSSLEKTLSQYQITAAPRGEPEINGNTATANIDLTLSADGTTEKPKIFIKIVEEDGQWRFCGEGKATS